MRRPITRRHLLRDGTLIIAGAALTRTQSQSSLPETADDKDGSVLRIGILADAHYADIDTRGNRFYRESLGKLKSAVSVFREARVDLAVELGDWIDGGGNDFHSLKTANDAFRAVGARRLFVLGNHCAQGLSKAEFLGACGQLRSYFSTDIKGLHLIVLDGCFRSDGTPYDSGNFDWKDSDIPSAEQEWLQWDLDRSRRETIVFVHQRIDQEPGDPHCVRSSPAVRRILERSGNVLAVFQGHAHVNDLKMMNGIAYCTLAAMVEGSGPQSNAFGVLHIGSRGRLKLQGYGQLGSHPLAQQFSID